MEELDAMKLPVFFPWILVKVCKTGTLSVPQMSSLMVPSPPPKRSSWYTPFLRVIVTLNLNRP